MEQTIQESIGAKLAGLANSNNLPELLGAVRVVLTATQVKALRASPATILAAPGAGKVAQFVGALLRLGYGGNNGFTESDDNLGFKYVDGAGDAVSGDVECTGFIDQTADTYTSAVPKADAIVAAADAENKPIVLHNLGDGEFAGNAADDNTLEVFMAYRIFEL
jgi:hypothetical protein